MFIPYLQRQFNNWNKLNQVRKDNILKYITYTKEKEMD